MRQRREMDKVRKNLATQLVRVLLNAAVLEDYIIVQNSILISFDNTLPTTFNTVQHFKRFRFSKILSKQGEPDIRGPQIRMQFVTQAGRFGRFPRTAITPDSFAKLLLFLREPP